jgi:hypothetical protein
MLLWIKWVLINEVLIKAMQIERKRCFVTIE